MRATLIATLCAVMLLLSGVSARAGEPADRAHLNRLETPTSDGASDGTNDDDSGDEATPLIAVVSEEPVLEPGGDHRFRVRIDQLDEAELAAGALQVRVLTEPLTHPSQLEAGGVTAVNPNEMIAEIDTPVLQPGETFETDFTVQANEFPLNHSNAPGVYLTTVRWAEGGVFTVDPLLAPQLGSPLVWNGDALDTMLDLASIVPIVYPAGESPPTTPAEVEEALQSQRAAQRILPAATSLQSLLAVDPRLVAYVRSLGASASADARELVDRVTSEGVPSFALQYADADPLVTALLRDEHAIEAPKLSFLTRYFTAVTEQVESDLAHPRGSPETESLTDDSVPPSFDELLSWDASLDDVAWPSPGSVTRRTLDNLTAAGYTQVVVGGDDARGAAKGSVGEATVYHSDALIENAARDLLLASSDFDTDRAAAQLAAVTALHSALGTSGTPAQALLAMSRESMSTVHSLDELVAVLEALPWVRYIPTSELRLGSVTLEADHDIQPALAALERAVIAENDVVEYSRVLEEPQLLIDYQRDRLLTTLSVQGALAGTRAEMLEVDERVATYLAGNASLREGVHIVDTENTRLLGSTSNIPLQLRNTLPFDAAVRGTISTGSAALIVRNPKLGYTVIPAESTINELVTVQSRASSGQVDLSVRLHDTHEGHDITHTTMNITLSGTTETITLTTLSIIVVALFTGGIWRSLSRRRHQRGTIEKS